MDPAHNGPQGSAPESNRRVKKLVLKYATRVQSISAVTFSGFVVLHLAAPIGAGLGLDASAIMLLTREYYQTPVLEPLLVWGSLGAHIASSVLRRALIGPPKKPSLHSATGWLLVPMTLLHAWTHRILPARLDISPSLLSYQYACHALHDSPITSLAIYGTMVLAIGYHAVSGLRLLASGRRKAARPPTDPLSLTGYAVLVSAVGLGLANMLKEGAEVPLWLAKRYDEVWKVVYRQ